MSSNFKDFEKVIKKFAKETGQTVRNVTKVTSFKIYRGITAKTAVGNPAAWQNPTLAPDGYVGGTLRASLTINADKVDKSVAPYYTTTLPTPKLVGTLKEDPVIFIGSNLPYTERVLMKAWSKQTPKNMARDVTLKEFKRLERINVT